MTVACTHESCIEVECFLCRGKLLVPKDSDGKACRYAGPPYQHDGCAGWPHCACPKPHLGDCPAH